MVSPVNDFDVTLQAEPKRTLAARGGVILSTTANTVTVDGSGAGTPGIITLVATPLVVSGSVVFTTSPNVPLTVDSTGLIATLHYADMGTSSVKVTVTLTANGIPYTDSQTITQVTIGSLGYQGALDATRNNTAQGLLSARPAGADGDFYFATDNLTLYQKVSGAWQVAGNNFTNTSQLTDDANLGQTATWQYVGGSGKPQDNATVGAPAGTNVGSVEASALVNTANTALSNANAAQTSANNANNAIAAIASDSVLSKGEKPAVEQQWDTIYNEQAGIVSQASSLGVDSTDYTAKFNALQNYLAALPGWGDHTVDTTIVAADFKANFTNYYAARQTLLNNIAAKAATMASGVTLSSTGQLSGGGTSGQVQTLPVIDGARTTDYAPRDYGVVHVKEFKQCSSIGISTSAMYCVLETMKPWGDNSGGNATQWAYVSANEVWKRSGGCADASWGAWIRDLDRSLYTGDLNATAGATWGNNISGQPQDTTNLVHKVNFEDGSKGNWQCDSVVAVAGQTFTKAVQFSTRDNPDYTSSFPVVAGELLYIEAYLDASTANYLVSFGVGCQRADGTYTNWSVGAVPSLQVNAGTGWTYVTGSFTVPTDSVIAIPWLWIGGSSNLGTARATMLRISRYQSGATVGATLGTNVGGQITSSNVSSLVAPQAIGSVQISDLRTYNYAEDGSGNPTSGAKLSSTNTSALKVANNSFQVGSLILSDYWFRLIQGVDGNIANGRVIWRGNNDATTRGGAPNIACLSVIPGITTGDVNTSAPPGSVNGWQGALHFFTITPTSYNSNTDNLDALQQIHVQYFSSTTVNAACAEVYVACPSRTYDGASGAVNGTISWSWATMNPNTSYPENNPSRGDPPQLSVSVSTYSANGYPTKSYYVYNGYLRIRIANTYGWSATRDFGPPSQLNPPYSSYNSGGGLLSAGVPLPDTTITGVAGSSGGGSGSQGGACPAPWVKVTLINGKQVNASDLHNGARLAAVNDSTMEALPQGGVVRDLATTWAQRYRVKLTDGTATEWSENHRFAVADRGWVQVQNLRGGDHILGQKEAIVDSVLAVGDGQVVSFRVEGAGTYFAGGLLCHNTKTIS